MAQIATTTAADPVGVPANTRIDRDPATGYLYALVRSTTANTWDLYRSTDGGATWTLHLSLLRSGIQEMGSIFIANDGHLYLSYRTNESSQDRIYFRRCRLNNPIWGPETLTGNPANAGVAGAIHQGMDIQLVDTPGRWVYIVIAVGTTFGGTSGVTLYGVLLDQPAGTHRYDNGFLRGRRQWMDITGTGRVVPSVDIEHTGTGKSSPNPHLWVAYGRDVLRMVKLSWTGAGWSGPATTQLLQAGLPVQDGVSGRWDGERWLMVVPHPTTTDTVLVVERDRGNTTTTLRQTPTHPAGVIRSLTVSYHGATATTSLGGVTILNRDIRVFAVGTSNPDLHYVDFNRSAGTWTSWTTVTTTDVLGTTPNQYSVRRGTFGNSRQDVAIAHPGSPNTVTSYHQVLTYAPHTPEWDVPAIGVDNGAAANVSAALALDWTFTDPDPADAQSAWALSRQVGAGAIQYFRASDSTWQAAEVKNAGGTSSRSLAAGWGLTSDAPHAYKVKVWDGSDTASLYSDAFVVIPSGKVNPVITAPTSGQVLNQDRVTITWTAAEQTAYRVQLAVFTTTVYDSGWVAGTATSHTPDYVLGDQFAYTARVQTRNLEGLPSDEVLRSFSVSYVRPSAATLAATPLPALGVIRVAVTNPPTPPPLNANPNFETDTTDWSVAGGTIARSTAQAHEGAASLLVTPSGAAATVEAYTSGHRPATAGREYAGRAWVRCSTARIIRIGVVWHNGTTETGDVAANFAVAADTWTLIQATGTAPAGTTGCRMGIQMTGTPPAGHLLYIDEAELRPGDEPPEVASVDLYRRPITDPNIIEHRFETADLSGWGPPYAGAAVRSNTRAHQGSWSYQLTADGSDTVAAFVETVKLPCTAGVTYYGDAWLAGSAAAKELFVQLRWFDAGGGFLSATNGLAYAPPAVNAWEYYWVAGTAPVGATQMSVCAVIEFPAAGDVVWVDEVRARISDLSEGVRVAAGLPANATYDDWGAVSGVAYEYRARVRSVIGTTVSGVWTP